MDGSAPPLVTHVPNSYYGDFQASGVDFPTEGCWEVTGTVGKASLTFVVFVVKVRQAATPPSMQATSTPTITVPPTEAPSPIATSTSVAATPTIMVTPTSLPVVATSTAQGATTVGMPHTGDARSPLFYVIALISLALLTLGWLLLAHRHTSSSSHLKQYKQ